MRFRESSGNSDDLPQWASRDNVMPGALSTVMHISNPAVHNWGQCHKATKIGHVLQIKQCVWTRYTLTKSMARSWDRGLFGLGDVTFGSEDKILPILQHLLSTHCLVITQTATKKTRTYLKKEVGRLNQDATSPNPQQQQQQQQLGA